MSSQPSSSTTSHAAPTLPEPPPYTTSHLDALLTRYLYLLDTYTTTHTRLCTSLSSGFFSLAQANRSSMLPPGQRYGQEMYDQRMKAGRRVRFAERKEGDDEERGEEERERGLEVEVEVYTYPNVAEEDQQTTPPSRSTDTRPTSKQTKASKPEAPSRETPLSPQPDPTTPSDRTSSSPTPPPSKPRPRNPNPISQFAALPPPPLRQSQASFTSAVSHIPLLLNTSRSMALLEVEIGRLRRELGLDIKAETEEDEKDKEAAPEEGEEEEEKEDHQLATSTSPTSPQLPNLARRRKVSEPRSRVLKLGS
jgi:hypothetical protein